MCLLLIRLRNDFCHMFRNINAIIEMKTNDKLFHTGNVFASDKKHLQHNLSVV